MRADLDTSSKQFQRENTDANNTFEIKQTLSLTRVTSHQHWQVAVATLVTRCSSADLVAVATGGVDL